LLRFNEARSKKFVEKEFCFIFLYFFKLEISVFIFGLILITVRFTRRASRRKIY
jgi:hypothetical protein